MAVNALDRRLVDEVRAAMARHKVSQVALAKALPLSQAALSRRLCGRVSFSLHEVEAIARVLHLRPSELLSPAFTATVGEWSEW